MQATWKDEIRMSLKADIKKFDGYAPLIKSYNRLMDKLENAKQVNENLNKEIDVLKSKDYKESGDDSSNSTEINALKQKLYRLNDELIDAMRNKSQNSQQLIDISNALKERDNEVKQKNNNIESLTAEVKNLKENIRDLNEKYEESVANSLCLKDELEALQMAYTSLENEQLVLRQENTKLLHKIQSMQNQLVEAMNKENEEFQSAKKKERRLTLEENIADMHVDITPRIVCYESRVPKVPIYSFEAHEGEVTSIVWHSSGKYFLTGGGDRKVKNWEIVGGGKCECRNYLSESNGGITSISFDSENKYLISSSNDFACRIYDYAQNRITYTLTGHSGKCFAAKFVNDGKRVVSGGNDRILKIWDFNRIACIKSIFVGSTINDLAVMDENNIISANFDGYVRFWDIRTDSHRETKLQVSTTRVTSLDLSPDRRNLLCCLRNDQLAIVDTRQKKIMHEFSAEGFHVASDWSRAVFSPDLTYIAAGSSDGSIFIWDVASNKLETQLNEHKDAVLAVAWGPTGTNLISASRNKIVTMWSAM